MSAGESSTLGLIDRDYMRASRREPRRPAWSGAVLLFASAAIVATSLWVFTKPPGWLAQQYAALRGQPGPTATAMRSVEAPARIPPQRVAPEVQSTAQPRGVARLAEVTPAPLAPVPRAQSSNALTTPGTIYRCKAYAGGMFWSSQHCSQHRALIDRIASVPVGIAFEQQVRIAEGQAHAIEQSVRLEQAEGARAAACASLQHERDTIWKRSGSGAGYVNLDQLGADQTRWRHIDRLMAEHRCSRR